MLLEEEDDELLPFRDRAEAGQILSAKLRGYIGLPNLLVLALPRGGVPVGFEIAKIVNAPLDVFIVRKLGVPGHGELAMGAIASGGTRILQPEIISALHISTGRLKAITAAERKELHRRERLYRGDMPALAVGGKTVFLVDDGVATGSTIRAAIAALRQLEPYAIVAAVPVAPISTFHELRMEADGVVCVATPHSFYAIGQWYLDFHQVTDDEVTTLLNRVNIATLQAA